MATLTSHSRYTGLKPRHCIGGAKKTAPKARALSSSSPVQVAGRGCKNEGRDEEAAEISAGRAESSDIGGFLLETEFSAAPREFG